MKNTHYVLAASTLIAGWIGGFNFRNNEIAEDLIITEENIIVQGNHQWYANQNTMPPYINLDIATLANLKAIMAELPTNQQAVLGYMTGQTTQMFFATYDARGVFQEAHLLGNQTIVCPPSCDLMSPPELRAVEPGR